MNDKDIQKLHDFLRSFPGILWSNSEVDLHNVETTKTSVVASQIWEFPSWPCVANLENMSMSNNVENIDLDSVGSTYLSEIQHGTWKWGFSNRNLIFKGAVFRFWILNVNFLGNSPKLAVFFFSSPPFVRRWALLWDPNFFCFLKAAPLYEDCLKITWIFVSNRRAHGWMIPMSRWNPQILHEDVWCCSQPQDNHEKKSR